MRSFLGLIVLICGARAASAQLPQTRLYSVFPPGITPGQISELRINSGADLEEVDRLIFNHPGIFATQKQQPVAGGSSQPVPNTFRVAVESNVPAGRYEVRAIGLYGMSNPRPLLVDPRPAVQETEPNNTAGQAQSISAGTVVDGLINGVGDVDCLRISMKQGQRLIVDCLAERIDSKLNPMLTLADADDRPVAFARNEYGRDAFLVFDVPADGDYFIKLQDETFAGGGEHLYRLQIHTGPHIRFVMPPAGVPGASGRFTLYGYNLPGSERLEPASAQAALEKLEVEIAVPQETSATFGVPSVSAGLDLFPYRLTSDAGVSNTLLMGLASAPLVLEQEPNDEPATAQKLTIPCELAGQSGQPGDVDRFSFEATKDQPLWIEVFAQRGGVTLDPYLAVEQITADANGAEQVKTLSTQDDTTANLAANIFDTATDDPAFLFKAPETGTYRVSFRDRAAASRGDPSLVYRLVVRPPQPDFRLVGIPSGQVSGQTWPLSLRRGDHVAMDVLAFRREGFEGPIAIRPLGLPAGVTTDGTVIREKETTATLVLTASEWAPLDPQEIRLVGSGHVPAPAPAPAPAGQTLIERPVRSGGIVWSRNGNTPAISQLETELTAAVIPEVAPFQLTDDVGRVTVHQGRQLLVPMKLVRRSFDEQLTLKYDGVAKSVKVDAPDVVFEKGQGEKTSRLFIRSDAPPGTYALGGTAQVQVPYRRNPQRAERLAAATAIAEQEAQLAKASADEAAARLSAQVAALQQAEASLQQAQQAVTAAQAKATLAQQAVAQAKQTSDAAASLVQTLVEDAKQATAKADEAVKVSAASEDPESKAQVEQAKQAAEEKQAALKTAQQARTQAQEQLTQAEATAKTDAEALAAAQQAAMQMQAAKQAAEQRKSQIEALSQAAVARAKAAEEARDAARKTAADAAAAAKPKNIAVHQPLPPIILTIKPAPLALEAKPATGALKPGETVDVAVTLKRQNEFAGPVKLSLFVPPGVAGLSAPQVDVPADATSAVLKVTIPAGAPEGDVAQLTVRATLDAGGEAIVDAPFALKVTK